ncbi:wax ester/triacylglycerol synthase family O-acyltransferase [Mycobacterium paragordonae]|uniref:WS/DGAT/MGAT family O-acyltransferase n=1 Tax=Mycobacterium paragordonae TaxID=1389713 RepID=UPI0010609AF0|nr:wax ester/triacylglycerol synthase family O-acyltransferase [Mycobacterium paragordonae]TDK94327.1 wax ester/triacylglycerol synthase family O-acyltransferase [Mycobacterium paragordonae]
MTVDRMSPLDAFFLYAEDDGVNHMHLGGLITLDDNPPPHPQILAFVASRLVNIPRYRQILRQVPFDLGRPVWVDDPHFDISYHIRRSALPTPGGPEQLRTLFERVMSQRLDRTRPLWELWVVEGLSDGGWAIISKTHHAMVDGVSGTELLGELFSTDPHTPEVADRGAVEPTPPVTSLPSDRQLLADAVAGLVRSPVEQVRALTGVLRAPRNALNTAGATWGMSTRIARRNVVSSLNGRVGPNRRFAYQHRSLEDIRTIREGLGGTINDVVLAAATQGFREFLLSRDEPVEGRTIRTLIPVAMHARDERGTAVGSGKTENRVTGMFAELPVGIEDPAACLREISEQLHDLKESGGAEAGSALTRVSEHAPAALFALGVRVSGRTGQGNVNTTITNVPGPKVPLYVLGRQVTHIWAYPPPFPVGARTAIGVYSYLGNVHFGVSADYSSVPDVDAIASGMQHGFDKLLNAIPDQ